MLLLPGRGGVRWIVLAVPLALVVIWLGLVLLSAIALSGHRAQIAVRSSQLLVRLIGELVRVEDRGEGPHRGRCGGCGQPTISEGALSEDLHG
jgi:hypothetical protein